MMGVVGGMRAELDDVEMVPELVGGGGVLITRALAVQIALPRLSSRRFLAVLAGGNTWGLCKVGSCSENGPDGTGDVGRGSGVVGGGGGDDDIGRLGLGCTCGLPAASATIRRDVAGAVGAIPRRWEFR